MRSTMEPIRIVHFSDVLCVWAFISEARTRELERRFGEQVLLEYRFLSVFGSTRKKLDAGWAKRGGASAYSEHVREVCRDFEQPDVHPDVWSRNAPQSSIPCHLFLAAVRLLDDDPRAASARVAAVVGAMREAFFRECRDVSQRAELLTLADELGLPGDRITAHLESGRAHAAWNEDLEMAREQSIRISPTMLFNEGRQRLTGNVGYRVIEANVRELVRHPGHLDQASWC